MGKIQKSILFPIEKEISKIDKGGNKSVVTISYKIKFIDSARFMATSLSNFVDNLTEGIHKNKCKYCNFFLNMKVLRIIWSNMNVYLAIKIIQTKLMKTLKRDSRTHLSFLMMISVNLFCFEEKVFILMIILMHWKSLMKHHCQKRGILNMEDIIYADYMHAKRVYKDFEIKKVRWISWFILRYITFGWYFQELQKNVFNYLSVISWKFLSAPGLAWPAALEKAAVKS